MLVPVLSAYDPQETADGSIDPLGLYPIADHLAVRLIPGVRERQQHPRFLTTIAVSLALCSEFPEDAVAADGVSEPWQVFEWHVVEGLVRKKQSKEELRGLPGQDKVNAAINDQVALSAKRYLKTPTVFGFHGVYRALAKDIGLEQSGRLGAIGYELLEIWANEQELSGFCGSGGGRGADLRRKWRDAIQAGMERGAVDRNATWNGWPPFREHLGIYNVGRKERQFLQHQLRSSAAGFRAEVLQFLTSEEGQRIWRPADMSSEEGSERSFHAALKLMASAALRELLEAIDAYERFSRLVVDAFNDALLEFSRSKGRVPPRALAELHGVRRASIDVPAIFAEVADRLATYQQSVRFREMFGSLAEKVSPLEWVDRLLQHHCDVQRKKPPQGKAPWFDRFDDGSCVIRARFSREEGALLNDSYVNAYRTKSLWSFAHDLKWVR